MRPILLLFGALLLGCASRASEGPGTALPSTAAGRSLAASEGPATIVDQGSVAHGDATIAVLESAPASRSFFSFSSSASSGPVSQLPSGGASSANGEMIDIEARFALQCDAVNECAAKFRKLVDDVGGKTTSDESDTAKRTEVTLEVRIPADRFEGFEGGLARIGPLAARDIKRRDVSKEYHDSELLLHERQISLARYEDLLKEAKTVPETIQVEQQLDRLRTEIDRIKGDLAWLKDRVASATVRVRIYPSATSEDAVFAPSATLYPTLRASMLFDLRSETARYGYVGGGFSVQFHPFARALTFDVDIAHTAMTDRPPGSDWAYLFLTGVDLYSDLLGGGRRKFLNPYLGFRAGYAITNGLGDFAFGGVVGVDLIKTKVFLLDLNARVLGLVGNDEGPHVAIQPNLNFAFAF